MLRTMNARPLHVMVLLAAMAPSLGCSVIKKLTGRSDDAGAAPSIAPVPILTGDVPAVAAPTPSTLVVPNPLVAPAPTQIPDAAGAIAAANNAAQQAMADAGAMPSVVPPPPVAMADAGAMAPAAPTDEDPEDPRHRRRHGETPCRDRPGRPCPPVTGIYAH